MNKTMKIEGMMCVRCQARVEKILNGMEGVTATVNLEEGTATCQCADTVTNEMLSKAVTDGGYTVTAVE